MNEELSKEQKRMFFGMLYDSNYHKEIPWDWYDGLTSSEQDTVRDNLWHRHKIKELVNAEHPA